MPVPSEKIIAEFKECPICKRTETISQIGSIEARKNGKIPEDSFIFIDAKTTLLGNPNTAIISVDAIITYYDICAGCGTMYCVKATNQTLPVQVQQQQNKRNRFTGIS